MTHLGTLSLARGNACARDVLSLKETTVIAKISEDRVRKDIENGWLGVDRVSDRRIAFRWQDSIALGAIYKNSMLSVEHRKAALNNFKWSFLRADCLYDVCDNSKFFESVTAWAVREKMRIAIDSYIYIDLSKALEEILPRLGIYVEGLSRVEEREDVLGGDAVFLGTRLPVLHVGEIYHRGEPVDDIIADYPYLNKADLEFARLYYMAHPSVGRPKSKKVCVHGKHVA